MFFSIEWLIFVYNFGRRVRRNNCFVLNNSLPVRTTMQPRILQTRPHRLLFYTHIHFRNQRVELQTWYVSTDFTKRHMYEMLYLSTYIYIYIYMVDIVFEMVVVSGHSKERVTPANADRKYHRVLTKELWGFCNCNSALFTDCKPLLRLTRPVSRNFPHIHTYLPSPPHVLYHLRNVQSF